MKTILDLLTSKNYPYVWVQGNHTRIIFSDSLFEVRRRTGSIGTSYSIVEYSGNNETNAVEAFVKSEKSK